MAEKKNRRGKRAGAKREKRKDESQDHDGGRGVETYPVFNEGPPLSGRPSFDKSRSDEVLVSDESIKYFENVSKMLDANEWENDEVTKAFLNSLSDNDLADYCCHPVASPVLQTSTPEVFYSIYQKHFRNRLEELCRDPIANFVVQKLISHVRKKAHSEIILDELLGNCRIENFKRNKEQWADKQASIERKRAMFEEFREKADAQKLDDQIKYVAPKYNKAMKALGVMDSEDESEPVAKTGSTKDASKRKHDDADQADDEIEALFKGKAKRATTEHGPPEVPERVKSESTLQVDSYLNEALEALSSVKRKKKSKGEKSEDRATKKKKFES
ncbi:hypothetical protein HDU96_000447 [Phlyctochytrium bullatum]|nr:hypothetical protein HDU96_000447 [Phlyctochytrium bullatum]